MPRRAPAQLQFDALTLEGALLPPEWLARVAALEAPIQAPADYGVPKGLQLRDEIGRFWRIAQAIWAEFASARNGTDAIGSTQRFARELLTQVFGFTDLTRAGERMAAGRIFPIAFETQGGRVPVVVGPHVEGMDQSVPRHGDGNRRRSAWGALQEYLNAADGALWGVATNGLVFRVGRDNASLTRPAWLEADLERIFVEERFADFSALWLLLHASRFGRTGQPVQEAPLERWREAGREDGSRARDVLRLGVEESLLTLGQGFVAHPSNGAIRTALAEGTLTPANYFNELLRLVYRMIFLLTVEERGILHAPDTSPNAISLYASGYGMRRLRERALRHPAHDRHGDLWISLRPVFAGLGRAGGEPALGLPGLGGLFAADQCPHLDAADIENRSLLTAVFRLAWLREGDALARVNWKDMGVEEFGSVYESLLELVPVVTDGGRHFSFAGVNESAGNTRKLTGSYYTPDALVQQLLDTALEPVVAQRLAEYADAKEAERALLSLTVVDPACGSGHFLLAAARRLAGHLARLRAGGTPGADEYRHALRDVVTHCIHGVDRNPMALELARMALWLEAYTPDRALGFLDHHLVCGDALVGLLDLSSLKDGIPDEAFKALAGDDKDACKLLLKLNRAGRKLMKERGQRGELSFGLGTRALNDAWAALDALTDNGVAGVELKRAEYERLRREADQYPAALAADLFVSAFLTPKCLLAGEPLLTELAARERFPTTSSLASALDGTMLADHSLLRSARQIAHEYQTLHWPLAFPSVFAKGGFDLVIGNPPWRLVARDTHDTAPDDDDEDPAEDGGGSAHAQGAAHEQRTGTPEDPDSQFARRQLWFRQFEYAKVGGRRDLYKLFTARAATLAHATGRVAFVLPLGMFVEEKSRTLRESLFLEGSVLSLLHAQNQRHEFFPEVHASYRFVLLTYTRQPGMPHRFSTVIGAQSAMTAARWIDVPPDDIRDVLGDGMSSPSFASPKHFDVSQSLVAHLRSFTQASYRIVAEFHTSSHKALIHRSRQQTDDWQVLRNRSIHQFDSFYSDPGGFVRADDIARQCRQKGIEPDVWSRSRRVLFRDIARSDDSRTLIATCAPVGFVSSYDTPMLIPDGFEDRRDEQELHFFVGCLNSFLFDFLVRPFVDKHVKGYVLRRLPLLAFDARSEGMLKIARLALSLETTARSPRDSDHWLRVAELNGALFHLAGIDRETARFIVEDFSVFWRTDGSSLKKEQFMERALSGL